jgi:hypothetical protein
LWKSWWLWELLHVHLAFQTPTYKVELSSKAFE